MAKYCTRKCKGFKIKIPFAGWYESGAIRCRRCNIWMDIRGAHLRDGSPAREGTDGWFCNCCNLKVRRIPRKKAWWHARKAAGDAGPASSSRRSGAS